MSNLCRQLENQPAKTLMLENLHCHTKLCRHASGEPLDLGLAAVKGGARVLGISDHAALPDDRWTEVRMHFKDLGRYEAGIELARAQCPELRILKGFECEGVPEYFGYYQDELLGQRGFDYLIGAGHYIFLDGHWESAFSRLDSPKAMQVYTDQLVLMIESGLFAFIAHPDLFGCGFDHWSPELSACTRTIAQAAKDRNEPLEINGNGFRKQASGFYGAKPLYPWRPFWEEVAQVGCLVIVTADAHSPKELFEGLPQGQKLAKELGLVEANAASLGLLG